MTVINNYYLNKKEKNPTIRLVNRLNIGEYMKTEAGERIILNAILKNQKKINEMREKQNGNTNGVC